MTTQIPRPQRFRPGDPPPWSCLPADARRRLQLARVLAALDDAGRAGPPDPPAGAAGATGAVAPGATSAAADDPADEPTGRAGVEPPRPRPVAADGFPFRFLFDPPPVSSAAVLVPLFEEDGETRVVLTRRAATLRAHRGEISFPGGRLEPAEGVVAAALREAEEEIGLDPRTVRPVGFLQALSTVSSGAWITPVVGVLPGRPSARPNPAEVARVFDVALADLLADGVYHEERWVAPGREVPGSPDGAYPVYFYEVATETVWGATGRMLTDLLAVVTGTAR